MGYYLGDITLPTPKPGNFVRKQIETGATIRTLGGATKKDVVNRKEQFILFYEKLTQTQVANILSEYNLETTRNFSVSETNLTIASTEVHIEITDRSYNVGGNEYREDLVLILTEVS